MSEFEPLLKSAVTAAREAGGILRQLQSRITVREKGPADLVTEADLAAQNAIEHRLLTDFPDFDFVGEEDNSQPTQANAPPGERAEYGWIVDPLDGTTNYVHGLDNYCVSIALRRGSQIVLGVIFDPVRGQLFHAVRSQGVYLDGKPLRTSQTVRLDEALIAASFAAKVPAESPEIRRFVQVMPRCRALRRMGSAALNLAYVAAGYFDAYWATSVKQWDVAAGLLCVEEAGGVITSIDGGLLEWERPRFLASATQTLHEELLTSLTIR